MKSKIKSGIITFLILLGAIIFQIWFSCAPEYRPAKNFLIEDEIEKDGYGLYSYVIFTEKPEFEDSVKYANILTSLINKIDDLEQVSKYRNDSNINIVYLPVNNPLPQNFYYSFDVEQKVNWILNHYNYPRAKSFLDKFETDYFDGPYIISYKQPLSKMRNNTVIEKYLIQDFSKVHPDVVSLWMDEFIKQSSQQEFWNEEHLKIFSNDLRNAIANSAPGLHEVIIAIRWIEKNILHRDD